MASDFASAHLIDYSDLESIYRNCSGPGGLKVVKFLADKLSLRPGLPVLDIGCNFGYQTCLLAKEYGVFVVGIDPGGDPAKGEGMPCVDALAENARAWGVQDRVLGLQAGVPDTHFTDNSFGAAYSSTALEMIRGMHGEAMYRECLAEIFRVLRPGALFGYADPMHLDVPIPEDLRPLVEGDWADCFASLQETIEAFASVGFEIVEADYAEDARLWWEEYAQYDVGCRANPGGDPEAIRVDAGRWLSFGYVIARKPS